MENPFKYFESILKFYVKDIAIKELPIKWAERHRFYHNTSHLIQIIKDIESDIWFKELPVRDKHALLIAAFFHDVVYNPKSETNEEDSINYFIKSYKLSDKSFKDKVCELIMVTKYRKRPNDRVERILWDADNAGFRKS